MAKIFANGHVQKKEEWPRHEIISTVIINICAYLIHTDLQEFYENYQRTFLLAEIYGFLWSYCQEKPLYLAKSHISDQ